MSSYDPANWYWSVDGHPGVVFSSADAAYVAPSDPAYVAWVALGNEATEIPLDGALAIVLSQYDLPAASRAVEPTNFTGLPRAQVVTAAIAAGCSILSTASIIGSISGTTLTVTGVASGVIAVGDVLTGTALTGTGVTMITALGSGTGGVGTYVVSPSQTAASGTIGAEPYYGGSGTFYRLNGAPWTVAQLEFSYILAFGVFDNGLSSFPLPSSSGTIVFTSVDEFQVAVGAMMEYQLAWARWGLDGGTPPAWGTVSI